MAVGQGTVVSRATAPVGLDSIPWLSRDQGRRPHHAPGPGILDPALEGIPAWPRLVAHPHLARRLTFQLPNHPTHSGLLVRALQHHRGCPSGQKDAGVDRNLVCVETDDGDTLFHDRLLSYAALVPLQSGTNPRSYDREPVAP